MYCYRGVVRCRVARWYDGGDCADVFGGYFAQVAGMPSTDLVRRALDANRELAAARLDLERGRARLRQAGLRPNPTLDIEHASGRLTGSPDERELSVGVALPIDIGGRRQRRIDVAAAELAVIEADIANRERQLTRDVLAAYIDAIAAIRDLETTDRLHQLDEHGLGRAHARRRG
jgi:outer membrane protein, heavy metal efflux system